MGLNEATIDSLITDVHASVGENARRIVEQLARDYAQARQDAIGASLLEFNSGYETTHDSLAAANAAEIITYPCPAAGGALHVHRAACACVRRRLRAIVC